MPSHGLLNWLLVYAHSCYRCGVRPVMYIENLSKKTSSEIDIAQTTLGPLQPKRWSAVFLKRAVLFI